MSRFLTVLEYIDSVKNILEILASRSDVKCQIMRCEDLPLSGSYANFEGYFSEEYFRASVIDGMTRAILEFFFCYIKVKRTLYIFSTRADPRDCVFVHRRPTTLFIFFRGLFRNWIRSQSRPLDVTHRRISRNCPPTITGHSIGRTSRRYMNKVPCLFFSLFFL